MVDPRPPSSSGGPVEEGPAPPFEEPDPGTPGNDPSFPISNSDPVGSDAEEVASVVPGSVVGPMPAVSGPSPGVSPVVETTTMAAMATTTVRAAPIHCRGFILLMGDRGTRSGCYRSSEVALRSGLLQGCPGQKEATRALGVEHHLCLGAVSLADHLPHRAQTPLLVSHPVAGGYIGRCDRLSRRGRL